MTPEEFLALRVPQPKALTTAQWDVVRADVRERAFFMAGVAQAQTLDLFKGEIDTVLRGEISVAEFRKRMREGLEKLGYKAPAGKEGTIHDLRSVQRLNVVAETNVRLAQGYAGYYRQHAARDVWPAQQMYRQTLKKEPRDWPRRWKETAARTAAPASSYNVSKMAGLIDSAIWTDLSRFGVPYAPFDFGSGMGTRMLDRKKTEAMGIAIPRPIPPDHDAPAKSFNDGLKQEVPLNDEEAKILLKETMEGLADVEGDTVTYRDPNGTIPITPQKVADVIATPNNGKIPLRQKAALAAYQEGGPGAIKPGSAKEIYLSRLIHRIEGQARVSSPPALSGHGFSSAEERAAFVESVKTRTSGGWAGEGFSFPTATFDRERATAAAQSEFPLVIQVTNFQTMKDAGPASDAISGGRKFPELFWIPAALFAVKAIEEVGEMLFVSVEEEEREE
jgi:hypothetical protein